MDLETFFTFNRMGERQKRRPFAIYSRRTILLLGPITLLAHLSTCILRDQGKHAFFAMLVSRPVNLGFL